MICRFYPGYTLDKIRNLTIYQFNMLCREISNFGAENSLKEELLEGSAGIMAARMMLPRKVK